MDKFIKLQSTTSTPFTSSQNLCDFSIPEDIYDFSSSYVNLRCRVGAFTLQTTEATDGSGGALANKSASLDPVVCFNPAWASNGAVDTYFENCSLIKNVFLDSAKKGKIEDIRRADVLFTNLKRLTKPIDKDTDYNYSDFAQVGEPIGSFKWGLSTSLVKEGTIFSKPRDEFDIYIPLKDFLGIGGAKEIDGTKTGAMRLNLELNISKIASMKQFLSTNTDVGSNTLMSADDIPTGQASITELTISTKAEFTDLEQSPYYVGMPIIVKTTGTGGATDIACHTIITGIALSVISSTSDGGTAIKRKKIVLTLAESIGNTSASGSAHENVAITPRLVTDTGSPALEFSDAQLVLLRVSQAQGVDQVNYFTYSTEEGNGNSLSSFNKQFQLERDAVSSVLMFPNEVDNLNSNNDDVNSYRTRTDNQDNSDRQIVFGKPLEDKMLSDGLMNMGMRYRDYRKANLSTNQITYSNAKSDGKRIHMIIDSHEPTQNEKLYQVNVESGSGGLKSYALFKQLPKQLVY